MFCRSSHSKYHQWVPYGCLYILDLRFEKGLNGLSFKFYQKIACTLPILNVKMIITGNVDMNTDLGVYDAIMEKSLLSQSSSKFVLSEKEVQSIVYNLSFIYSTVYTCAGMILTRAPRGTDRSPVYKEHFCYKLDSMVKNMTTEWNQKQQHFITNALDHCYEFGLLL